MATKKASSKKNKAKKVTKKVAKKAVKKVAKKVSTKSLKKLNSKAKQKPAKKIAAKKKSPVAKKAIIKKDKASSHLIKSEKPSKKVDLSQFVTPLDDRLLVQVSGVEKKTPGGLYIPDTVADMSGNLEGFVVAVGRGHMNKKGQVRPMDVKVGDRVVFSEFAGTKVKIQNEDLLILRESDVMGVVSI